MLLIIYKNKGNNVLNLSFYFKMLFLYQYFSLFYFKSIFFFFKIFLDLNYLKTI